MSNEADEFEYEVGFSFLAADEPLARRLYDLLEGRLKAFLYSKAQEQLAGRDGEAKFSEVFARKARVVVILHRKGWGETPWTRIERDAIRNRAFERGYDFTLWIPLDRPPQIPEYVPKPRLYGDIETFGERGVAAVIVALATERGASLKPETIEEKTQRAARAAEAETRREAFHGPGDGVMRARKRAFAMIDELKKWAAASAKEFVFETHAMGQNGISVVHKDAARRRATTLVVGWRQPITNSTDQSEFDVQIYEGIPDIPGLWVFSDAEIISRTKYYCDLASSDEVVWTETRQGDDPLTENRLLEKIVGEFLQKIVRR